MAPEVKYTTTYSDQQVLRDVTAPMIHLGDVIYKYQYNSLVVMWHIHDSTTSQ